MADKKKVLFIVEAMCEGVFIYINLTLEVAITGLEVVA